MSQNAQERQQRSVTPKDTLPSQSTYVPGQRTRPAPVSIEMIDVGRLPTVPASQRVFPPPSSTAPQSCPPTESVRVRVRSDLYGPNTHRCSTPSSQAAETPAAKVLLPFRRQWNGLRAPSDTDPELRSFGRYVAEIVRGIGMEAVSVYVMQMRPFKDLYRGMPIGMRETAKGGFTAGLDQGLTELLTERLTQISHRKPDTSSMDDMPERFELQRVVDLIDDTAGSMLPQRYVHVARDLLLMDISARAFENRPVQHLLRPFLRLLEDGHLPVGLTKERRFLVVTL